MGNSNFSRCTNELLDSTLSDKVHSLLSNKLLASFCGENITIWVFPFTSLISFLISWRFDLVGLTFFARPFVFFRSFSLFCLFFPLFLTARLIAPRTSLSISKLSEKTMFLLTSLPFSLVIGCSELEWAAFTFATRIPSLRPISSMFFCILLWFHFPPWLLSQDKFSIWIALQFSSFATWMISFAVIFAIWALILLIFSSILFNSVSLTSCLLE